MGTQTNDNEMVTIIKDLWKYVIKLKMNKPFLPKLSSLHLNPKESYYSAFTPLLQTLSWISRCTYNIKQIATLCLPFPCMRNFRKSLLQLHLLWKGSSAHNFLGPRGSSYGVRPGKGLIGLVSIHVHPWPDTQRTNTWPRGVCRS